MAACAYCRRPAGAQAPTCSCPATTARDEDLRQLLGEALRDGAALHTAAMHGREGTVTRVLRERTHPKLGRVILKYIGDTYLFGKKGGAAEDFTDQ